MVTFFGRVLGPALSSYRMKEFPNAQHSFVAPNQLELH